jgi:Flp pilus assembly pilin Flp
MDRVVGLWMRVWRNLGGQFGGRGRGQGFVEYGFILLFVGVALTAALVALQGGISGIFSTIASCMGIAPGATC